MARMARATRKRLGEILIDQGLIHEEHLIAALNEQKRTGELLGQTLVRMGYATEDDIASTIVIQFGLPFLPVTKYQINEEVKHIFPPRLLRQYQFLPIDKIGLYRDERRASWPVTHTVRPMPEPPRPKPQPKKGPTPVLKVKRRTAAVTIDGSIDAKEWPGPPTVLKQNVDGREGKPHSRAWLAWDDAHLWVALDNAVDPKKPLPRTNVWGRDDACEVAVRNPAAGAKAPIFVLRGWPNGHFESSTEAGAPAPVAAKAGKGVHYAAKVLGKSRWTAEFRIAFAALGLDPRKHRKLQLNLTARKAAGNLWLMWEGTRAHSWQVDHAGLIELE